MTDNSPSAIPRAESGQPELANPVAGLGASIKKGGTYLRYIREVYSKGDATISELHVSTGIPMSDVSRDISLLDDASPPLIETSITEIPNVGRRKVVRLAPLGRGIAELAEKTMRANMEPLPLGPMDEKLIGFFLSKALSPVGQTRMAAWDALLKQAGKERLWESQGLWKLLIDVLTDPKSSPESLDYASNLLYQLVVRAFSPSAGAPAKELVNSNLCILIKKRGEGTSEAFWRSIVDEADPLYTYRSNIIGIMKVLHGQSEFFQISWKLWLWRAGKEKPEDDIDDSRFERSIDPIVREFDAAPYALRRTKIEEAFFLTEEAPEYLKARAVRVLKHLTQ